MEGRLTVVRWNRDSQGELLISFDLQTESSKILKFDLAEGEITKIMIGSDMRAVG